MIALGVLLVAQLAGVSAYFAQESGGEASEEFIYKAGDLRNPFMPLFVPTPTPTATPMPSPTPIPQDRVSKAPTPTPIPTPELELIGILWDSKRPMAVINGRIVFEKDKVEGAQVVKIEQKKIWLDFLGRSMELQLVEDTTISID